MSGGLRRALARLAPSTASPTDVSRRRGSPRILFDTGWYAQTYGWAPADGDPFQHFLREGWRNGDDPHPLFDTIWYLATHGDPATGTSPLEDFVAHPTQRRPNRYFDPALWVRHMADPGEDVVEYLDGLTRSTDDPRLYGRDGFVQSMRPGRGVLRDGSLACVYAHFDPHGLVDRHVLAALDGLADAGWQTVFCSASPLLRSADEEEVRLRTAFVLTVANTGLDWGLYHAGLRFVLDRLSPAAVTLLNSSVYVLPSRLPLFLERVAATSSELVGATDSHEFRYHLQSYFLHLGPAALGELAAEFLHSYVPVAEKRYVINAYEIGVTRRAEDLGLTIGAAFPYEQLTSASGTEPKMPLNPARHFWDVLLANDFPFLKVQLVASAPNELLTLDRIDRLLPAEVVRDVRRHVDRVGHRVSRW